MFSVGAICLKIGFALGGIGGGECHPPCDSTWWLSWLAVERSWSALAGLFLSFTPQRDVETAPLPRALTIVSLLMSGCGRGHEPQEN